ncbi:hypothetical protein CRUP_032625 [Coryphaenoides rupestris]|nr:hypothetical protein CRUP_032625 [Coryphaenoides rupestris]
MDMLTDVAMDQQESHGEESVAVSGMEAIHDMMLDFARLDRELSCFAQVVHQLTAEANRQPPDALFSLAQRVEQSFVEQKAALPDTELHNHQKMVTFLESVTLPQEAENVEEDEDVVVAPSQVNFTCPLTQVDMENPMRNKVCPVVGCTNTNVTEAHLVPDHLLRRKIQRHNSQKV